MQGTKVDITKNDFAVDGAYGSVSKDSTIFDSFPHSIKSIIASLRVVIDSDFKQATALILEIATRLDKVELCERNHVSRTIKKILKDKIQEGKFTEKWIEECLAPEYKRQYIKSEPSSLSKQRPKRQLIEVSTGATTRRQWHRDGRRLTNVIKG